MQQDGEAIEVRDVQRAEVGVEAVVEQDVVDAEVDRGPALCGRLGALVRRFAGR